MKKLVFVAFLCLIFACQDKNPGPVGPPPTPPGPTPPKVMSFTVEGKKVKIVGELKPNATYDGIEAKAKLTSAAALIDAQ